MSAKERAFIIYATDGSGTQDRFITTKNLRNELDWKNQFMFYRWNVLQPTTTILFLWTQMNHNARMLLGLLHGPW